MSSSIQKHLKECCVVSDVNSLDILFRNEGVDTERAQVLSEEAALPIISRAP